MNVRAKLLMSRVWIEIRQTSLFMAFFFATLYTAYVAHVLHFDKTSSFGVVLFFEFALFLAALLTLESWERKRYGPYTARSIQVIGIAGSIFSVVSGLCAKSEGSGNSATLVVGAVTLAWMIAVTLQTARRQLVGR